jgi:hypothetical protein
MPVAVTTPCDLLVACDVQYIARSGVLCVYHLVLSPICDSVRPLQLTRDEPY